MLLLDNNVEVLHATVAAGHPSSSSIYPACFAPYLIATACSDGNVRFWCCQSIDAVEKESLHKFQWNEWEMLIPEEDASVVKIPGKNIVLVSLQGCCDIKYICRKITGC